MLNRIKQLLLADGTKSKKPRGKSDMELAAAALLVEAAVLDGTFDDAERAVIERLLKGHFNLTDADVTDLIRDAESTIEDANELYTLARTVKDGLEISERTAIIEMLWEVAYADGELHDYEANLVRRLAGQLYVSDRDSGEARKRVLAKLG
ncbi:MAG: TerB family tellurite resistance protein [Rhodospirillales bacterium]|nr:TerB family tellurite resistance protein [Rhodospirillales bacterium]